MVMMRYVWDAATALDPGYAMSLDEEHRSALRDLLRVRLPTDPAGSVPLTARAWAVRGVSHAGDLA
jgi:hypothetical protein